MHTPIPLPHYILHVYLILILQHCPSFLSIEQVKQDLIRVLDQKTERAFEIDKVATYFYSKQLHT